MEEISPRALFFLIVITALFDKERNLLGFGKITRDLTERKKIEGLLEADRRKNELLALLGREVSALTASTFKAASTIRFLPS